MNANNEKTKTFVGNLDFENLSNSLFHEWNNFQNVAITDDTKATNTMNLQTLHRNRIELETIFTRVGLQMTVACKLADEVYEKLGLTADQTISFNDFLSLIHCNSDLDNGARQQQSSQQQHHQQWSFKSIGVKHTDNEYTINPLNDHMIIDLHAHSGLCFRSFLFRLA